MTVFFNEITAFHFISVIGGGNGDHLTTLLHGNALQPVMRHSAASTCMYPRWPTSQQPQSSLVSLVRTSVIVVLFQSLSSLL